MSESPNTGRAARTGRIAATLLALSAGLAGCGGDGGDDGPEGARPGAASGPSSQARRDDRPEALEARRLLDMGRADLARPLVESLVGQLPVEGLLLRARLSFLEGDQSAWLADVEEARRQDPADPRVFATAAEIYAAMDRRLAAKEELERGIAALGGLTPELQRAAGVLALVTPGRAKAGLDMLEAAGRADPGLPFVGRPLGQAYLLAAKFAQSEGNSELALERLERSLAHDPQDRDARRLKGQLLVADKRFDQGLEILEQLFAEGDQLAVELGRYQWLAGTFHHVAGHREAARKHFLRARELGEPAVEQRSAKLFLEQEAETAYGRALEALAAEDEQAFRAALTEAIQLHGAEASARRFYAARFAQAAEDRLQAGDLGGATPFVAAAVYADRDAEETAVVRAALYFEKALECLDRQDAAGALEFAVEAATSGSDDPFMWQFLGELQYGARDFGAAAGSLQRALALSEAAGATLELTAQVKLARSMVMMDREAEARTLLERGVAAAEAAGEAEAEATRDARAFLATLH